MKPSGFLNRLRENTDAFYKPAGAISYAEGRMSETLGTTWVAPGEGDNLHVLLTAAGGRPRKADETRATDLKLTGRPLTDFDRIRICYIKVGKLGSYKTAMKS